MNKQELQEKFLKDHEGHTLIYEQQGKTNWRIRGMVPTDDFLELDVSWDEPTFALILDQYLRCEECDKKVDPEDYGFAGWITS